MYYEEQWIEGALCWRTSPYGAWTRYTANELAHRYESAEKRAADAQATVEALQAQIDKTNLENAYANNETQNILRGGILERDVKISTLRQQVEALQRVRDEFERERDQLHAALMEAKAALDAEREKVAFVEKTAADFQVLWRAACDQREAFETHLSQLQALVRALPVVTGELEVDCGACYYVRALDGKENPVVCGLMTEQATAFAIKALLAYRATLDATTPATTKT